MIYSNYRSNMPHYDSMQNNYNPMGINDYKVSQNQRMQITNTMPTMPGMEDMFNQRPFIPETEIPFDIDGDMPALPRRPGMPQTPGIPQSPEMPQMPGMMPGMPGMMPGMPGMMPGMPNGMMPEMPGMPEMPQTPGMTPNDGNMYPMPGMPNGMPQMNCQQLREMMRRMNCPMNGNGETPRPIVPPENDTASPPQNNTRPQTPPRSNNR